MQTLTSPQSACTECPGRYVCRCLQITEEALISTLTTQPVRNLKELRMATGAGAGCNCCHRRLKDFIEQYAQSSSPEPICS
jgi:bacterioferritin-associated ferredoxin